VVEGLGPTLQIRPIAPVEPLWANSCPEVLLLKPVREDIPRKQSASRSHSNKIKFTVPKSSELEIREFFQMLSLLGKTWTACLGIVTYSSS
jgi:hypothetical protein